MVYQKGKKELVCFQSCPCHQPDGTGSAAQMRYTHLELAAALAALHPGTMKGQGCMAAHRPVLGGCAGVWLLSAVLQWRGENTEGM